MSLRGIEQGSMGYERHRASAFATTTPIDTIPDAAERCAEPESVLRACGSVLRLSSCHGHILATMGVLDCPLRLN